MPRGKGSKRGSSGSGPTRGRRRPPAATLPIAETPAADPAEEVAPATAADAPLDELLAEASRAVLAAAGPSAQPAAPLPDPAPHWDPVAVVEATPLSDLLSEAHRAVLDREERRLAERQQAGRQAPTVRPIPNPGWLAAALLSWVLVALALLFPPALLRSPAAVPFAPAAASAEASLRYGLWLARHRVDDFAARAGRLPSFLGETGTDDGSITLTVTGERSYELQGRAGALQLTLTGRMAADSFVGGSRARLGAR